jgi:hypothetical protein
LTGTQTLTNKTLTAPTITSPTVTGLFLNDGSIVFEGATANDFETTLTATDPTADRTITLPDATGTVVLADATQTLTNKTINGANNTLTVRLANDITGFGTGVATFLATPSSANLAAAVTDETGTGSLVFSASPTFTGTAGFAAISTSGNATVGGSLTVTGDLTINGTTTTINSTTLSVDDKNVVLGDTASPSDASADGGGITLKGTTDKTFNWVDATDAWTSSEHVRLAAGKNFVLAGSTSGTVTLATAAAAGTTTITFPATTGTVVTTGDSGTVTNTMLAGSIANAKLANSSVTVGTTAISLGSSSTTLAGLTSVTSTGFTGALTGNASTATTLATARNIQGVSFNGSADITVVTGGTGVTVTGTSVAIGQAVGTASNVQFNSLGVGTAGSGTAGQIRATNEITAYYSDKRLKENIAPIDNALEKVLKLNGVTYTANTVAEQFGYTDKSVQVGLLAQEVQAVLPQVVVAAPFDIEVKDGKEVSKSGEDYLTVKYEKIVALLVEAIKDLNAKVEGLEAQLKK